LNILKEKISKWASIDENELEVTSVYGIRKYTRDAIVNFHVDTCRTHVLSAIINVARSLDDNEDWGLQIYDHNNTIQEIFLKPGEVILYESAKCAHGRIKPLKGDYYSNLFIHFRPSKAKWDFDWF